VRTRWGEKGIGEGALAGARSGEMAQGVHAHRAGPLTGFQVAVPDGVLSQQAAFDGLFSGKGWRGCRPEGTSRFVTRHTGKNYNQ